MNVKQEKDIIRTLVKSGHETLAKTFARSRGYRVKAAKVIDAVEVFWDTDSDPSNPGWVIDVMPLGNIPFAPKYYHLKKSASDRELYKAVHETLKNEGMKASPDIRIEIDR